MIKKYLCALTLAATGLTAHAEAVASASTDKQTLLIFFLQLRAGAPPLTILGSTAHRPKTRPLLHLVTGGLLRVQVTPQQYAEHLNHELNGSGQWLTLTHSHDPEARILAPAHELVWIDARYSHVILRAKEQTPLFGEPSSAAYTACLKASATCAFKATEVELADSRLVSNERGAQLFYKIHPLNEQHIDGEGWARAEDFLASNITAVDRPSSALIDELLPPVRCVASPADEEQPKGEAK